MLTDTCLLCMEVRVAVAVVLVTETHERKIACVFPSNIVLDVVMLTVVGTDQQVNRPYVALMFESCSDSRGSSSGVGGSSSSSNTSSNSRSSSGSSSNSSSNSNSRSSRGGGDSAGSLRERLTR